MIQMNAVLFCDRCDQKILEMEDVFNEDEAYRRLETSGPEWGGEDEDGKQFCAACWAKWDAEHPEQSAPSRPVQDAREP